MRRDLYDIVTRAGKQKRRLLRRRCYDKIITYKLVVNASPFAAPRQCPGAFNFHVRMCSSLIRF